MKRRQYASILPSLSAQSVGNSSSDASDFADRLPKRRVNVSVACNTCRRKKIRCDGHRPTCEACRGLTERCIYREEYGLSQESQKLLVEVIESLSSGSPDTSLDLLRRLRGSTDASSIVAILRAEANDTALLEDVMNGITSPAIASSSKNQPINLHPLIDDTDYKAQGLVAELETHYPEAYLHFAAPTVETLRQQEYQQLAQRTQREYHDGDTLVDGDKQDGYWEPNGEADSGLEKPLCDPRLRQLEINRWTPVNIDNDTAARVISLYLETDHPLLGFFDPDLFLNDLIEAGGRHCSPALVNALLYWAAQMYCGIDPGLDALPLAFCAEAERLWLVEQHVDSAINIVVAHFLSLGYLGQGRDHSVLSYLTQATEMSVRMGLFDTEGNHRKSPMASDSTGRNTQNEYAAWGTFNWMTLMLLFYRQPGSPSLPCIPNLPIPDAKGNKALAFMGGVFPYICQLWRIMHNVGVAYNQEGGWSLNDSRASYFAEFKFRELLAWSGRLPPHLQRNDQNPHYAQILHIWFHAAILDIFRPCMLNSMRHQPLRTFSSANCCLGDVYNSSIDQLKHLVINFRMHFASSTYTLLWHTSMIYLTNAILVLPNQESWYYYFLLCIYGYESLGRSWRVTRSISTALLSMAIRNGNITSDTARKILDDLDGTRFSQIPGKVRAPFMVDLDLAQVNPSFAAVESMADNFEENAYIGDFTNLFESKK